MTTNNISLALMLISAALIAGCASTPKFETANVEEGITPKQAAANNESYKGKTVLWGGMVINSTNLKEETQLEVLAYPLNRSQKPDINQQPLGRFLAIYNGYLETSDYTNGRTVTIKGPLQSNRTGKIGEMEYTYPTLNIEQLHLWALPGQEPETQFRIGIGVMFHN